MKKRDTPQRIILKLRDGSLADQGFPVSIESGEEGVQPTDRKEGHLSAHPELLEPFRKWQTAFETKAGVRLGRTRPPQTFSCEESADRLKNSFNDWLNRGDREEWKKIRDVLVAQATKRNNDEKDDEKDEVTRIIVQTNDISLWQLPWSALDLSHLDIKAEIAFSLSEWKTEKIRLPRGTKVRILAVFGDAKGIDTNVDRLLLQAAPQAEIEVLTQPSKTTLLKYLLNPDGWHIFFFAGHSGTEEEGRFQINQKETLTVDELKNHFKVAIKNGLQLAIFNSCDGIGLAKDLAELNLPQSIVMRLPVPDEVAQKFLELFLERFAKQGKSLYASVYETRGLLAETFKQYPGVEWLPMICQNPAVVAGSWGEWTKIPRIVWFWVFFIPTATIFSLASWLYHPFWLDELLIPIQVEKVSVNIPPGKELKSEEKLYSGDEYEIEFSTDAKTDGYVYVYQRSNHKIQDLMKQFNMDHKTEKTRPQAVPPFNKRPPILELSGEAGRQEVCVLAFREPNPYLEGLLIDSDGYVTHHRNWWQYPYPFWDMNRYWENRCYQITSGNVSFESLGKR